MCTLSFLPAADEFLLGMNRDEKRTRVAALPPFYETKNDCVILSPSEPNGGTWISLNDAGLCFALINWHRINREPLGRIASRGQVVPAIAASLSVDEAGKRLRGLSLPEMRPFRLIAVSSLEKRVTEWQWDLLRLEEKSHPWQRQHWFSSGFDEIEAERQRQIICHEKSPPGAETQWLRALHQSHAPVEGPFSICMHREDAVTVSYTEIEVGLGTVTMRYQPGSPCSGHRLAEFSMPRLGAAA